MHPISLLLRLGLLLSALGLPVEASSAPFSRGSSSLTSSLIKWTVPSHLSAERGDVEWLNSGLANDESLTSLIDRERSDSDAVDDEQSVLSLVARALYLTLLFSPAFWTSGLAFWS